MNNNLLTVKWCKICTYLHTTVTIIDYRFKRAHTLAQTMRGNVSQIIWFKCLRYHMFFFCVRCAMSHELWVIIIVLLRLKTHDDTFRLISTCKIHSTRLSQIDALSLCCCRRVFNEKWWKISLHKGMQTYSTNNTFSIIAKLVVEVSAIQKMEKNRKVIINASITSLFQHYLLVSNVSSSDMPTPLCFFFFVIRKNKASCESSEESSACSQVELRLKFECSRWTWRECQSRVNSISISLLL